MVAVGRLTKDVESKTIKINGEDQTVANFSIATDDRGNTDYFDVVAWRKLGENCAKFLGKGRMVLVDGKMKRRSYDNNAGVKVYVWELIADDVRFLDSNKSVNDQGAQPQTQQYQQPQYQQQAPQYQQPQQQYQQPQQSQPQQQYQQQPQQPYQPTSNPTGFPPQQSPFPGGIKEDDLPF